MTQTGTAKYELVVVETGEVEMLDFSSDYVALTESIIEMNEDMVLQGLDALDYRVVDADTRHCPDREHSSSEHATQCLAGEWRWEQLGQ